MEDEELKFGPNGGLVFCLEFLLENISWLEEALDSGEQAEIFFNLVLIQASFIWTFAEVDDDYIIFDCPGQIELYTHLTVMKQLVDILVSLLKKSFRDLSYHRLQFYDR